MHTLTADRSHSPNQIGKTQVGLVGFLGQCQELITFCGCSFDFLHALGELLILFFHAVTIGKKPNIVFFIADDVSQDDFGCYGHPIIKTPNVDALASKGMRFDNAYLTTSSCSPSRCSIITGRYPHNTGAPELHVRLPQEQVRFPELLREAGYYTVLSGKNHMFGNKEDLRNQ